MAANVIHGKDIRIYNDDGAVVAGSRSCDITVSTELIQTSSPSTGVWETHVTGKKSWRVTTNYLVTALDSATFLNVGTNYNLKIMVGGRSIIEGSATLVTSKITATLFNLAQGVFEFRGNGALAHYSGSQET